MNEVNFLTKLLGNYLLLGPIYDQTLDTYYSIEDLTEALSEFQHHPADMHVALDNHRTFHIHVRHVNCQVP